MNRAVFNVLLADYTRRYPSERPGQRAFSVVALVDSAVADSERGGPCDPFYDNSKIESFLEKTLPLLLASTET